MKKTLVTSALPYANGYIHLGHAAGAYLPADIYVRRLRLKGEPVLYVCGSDEHGVAITISADKEKVSPQEIIDKYHNANREAFEKFGMAFDIYSRTSLPEHHETAREFFGDFLKKGYLLEKEEEQFYDGEAKMFLPDRYVEGICPNCGFDHARGDQCDNCGAYYNQTELKNPISVISKTTPEVRKTTHWYFRFDMFQQFLEQYIESHAGDWKDNVLQQTRSWLKAGLVERAITRDLTWGVKIDGIEGIDPAKSEGKRIYVWFDAVLGYITFTKQWANQRGKSWEEWWQSADTRYLAFIGKDNIVFHTLIFPAMLHAAGNNFILPDNVPANEFLNLEGQKFSKSRNWSIDLRDFHNDFPEPQSVDSLRYALAMNFPETKDSDFTWKDFQTRNNSELAAIFGNFVNRTLQFLHKNFGGKVPTLAEKYSDLTNDWFVLATSGNEEFEKIFAEKYTVNDRNLIKELAAGFDRVELNYERFRFRDAITETMSLGRAANKYFNDEEPWKRVKSDPDYAAKTMFVACQLVRTLSVLLAPIIPFTAKSILATIGETPYAGETTDSTETKENIFDNAIFPHIEQGRVIGTPQILFKQIEDAAIEAQTAKLGDKGEAKPKAEEKPELMPQITIDDFMKVELRTAKIINAEKLKKSKKLMKLQVDLGFEKRQIVAGIAEHYDAEYLVGKTIVVVANLAPAKLMGEESNGMMLAASLDGKLFFVTPEQELGPGAKVK